MLPAKAICIFMIFGFLGWIYESIYCTVTSGKWQNRGFVYGPICPIYGIGAVVLLFIMRLVEARRVSPVWWQVFCIATLGSAVLEYVTSWGLEKLFHALWWDYSSFPLNIRGRISLFTSLGFGGAGLLIYYWLAPFTERLLAPISPLSLEFLALFFLAIFMVDLTLTVNTLLHFDHMVTHAEEVFNRGMDAAVESTRQRAVRFRDGIQVGQKAIAERLSYMSKPAQAAIRRVRSFRYKNTTREFADTVLRMLQRRGKNK